MGKTLKMLNVTPEFFMEQPGVAGELIARQLGDLTDAIGVVIIGSRADAQGLERGPLFMYGPVEEIGDDLTSAPSARPEDQP